MEQREHCTLLSWHRKSATQGVPLFTTSPSFRTLDNSLTSSLGDDRVMKRTIGNGARLGLTFHLDSSAMLVCRHTVLVHYIEYNGTEHVNTARHRPAFGVARTMGFSQSYHLYHDNSCA
jgi:hypothetical protein